MKQIDLTGHIAFVTGGGGQIGRAIVRTLAECGADVAVGYHASPERADALVTELAAMGRAAVAAQLDVANLASVYAARDYIAKTLGNVDILVNCAVIQYKWTGILQQATADFTSQFESCVLHNVNTAKAFVPAMQAAGWGRVIGINSECSMRCDPGAAAYSSAKRGMDGILRCLAKEVGIDGVTVNQVAPGWMISDNDRANGTEVSETYDETVPLGHRGEDSDIADAVAFFASDMARFISGAYLSVSGGRVMPSI